MPEQKKYPVAGKSFELKPQTLRQRMLANPVWSKILQKFKQLFEASAKEGNLGETFSIAIDLHELQVAGDDSFPKFLSTILSPEGQQWKPEMIEQNFELMKDITEDMQQEVLQDFLSRMSRSNLNSTLSTLSSSPTTIQ